MHKTQYLASKFGNCNFFIVFPQANYNDLIPIPLQPNHIWLWYDRLIIRWCIWTPSFLIYFLSLYISLTWLIYRTFLLWLFCNLLCWLYLETWMIAHLGSKTTSICIRYIKLLDKLTNIIWYSMPLWNLVVAIKLRGIDICKF